MEWNFANGIPIYQQIVQTMKIQIANGTYAAGSKIPAVREIAMEAGVNPNTMQRALSELERDGLLRTERTSGRFVTEDAVVLGNLRRQLGERFIRELFENLRNLGMTRNEIIEAVEAWAEDGRTKEEGTE